MDHENFKGQYGLNNEIADKWGVKAVQKNGDDTDDQFRAADAANSEHNYVESKVKRTNLIQLFLRGTEVDKYIVQNLYGKQKFKTLANESMGE
jgi:hypothetical protein